MKKFLLVMLTIILLPVSAVFAQGTATVTELNWTDIEPQIEANGISGDFYTFDQIALTVWIPSELEPETLTDDDLENGYIAYFSGDDAVVAVVYMYANGIDLDEYKEVLAGYEDVSDIEEISVNGVPAISYTVPNDDTVNVSFATEAGYILEFTFFPMSDKSFNPFILAITSSIQETE